MSKITENAIELSAICGIGGLEKKENSVSNSRMLMFHGLSSQFYFYAKYRKRKFSNH